MQFFVCEGEKLFQRYDDGREQQIDSWEDPGFEVYHQTDRYGFIHDKRLPQKNDPNETKAQGIEMERLVFVGRNLWNFREYFRLSIGSNIRFRTISLMNVSFQS